MYTASIFVGVVHSCWEVTAWHRILVLNNEGTSDSVASLAASSAKKKQKSTSNGFIFCQFEFGAWVAAY
jgi:hypothetical protein